MKVLSAPRSEGFTLIEMIMVITLTGVVAVLISAMSGRQMESYVAGSRRAVLVAEANTLLHHLEHDIRNAVPNSLRVSGRNLELVPIRQSLRYRAAPGSLSGSDALDFSAADASFQVLGNVTRADLEGRRLVVYNTGQESAGVPVAGLNIYAAASAGPLPAAGAHVITPVLTGVAVLEGGNEDTLQMAVPHQFSLESPRKRMYVVDTAISWRCDLAASTLERFRDYPLQFSQPLTAAQLLGAGARQARVSSHVSECDFSWQRGTALQSALLTVQMTLEDAGEKISVLHQIHVDNVP